MFAFGILTDFRTRLFPGCARLVELADRMNVLQVEALCWCGKRATHNARTENGEMVTEGEVIVVGDVDERRRRRRPRSAYEVLCRQHHRRRLTAARAQAVEPRPSRCPFGLSRPGGGYLASCPASDRPTSSAPEASNGVPLRPHG